MSTFTSIECPQPRRHLKRTIDELEQRSPQQKRQKLSSSGDTAILQWLSAVVDRRGSRSDGFLRRQAMDAERNRCSRSDSFIRPKAPASASLQPPPQPRTISLANSISPASAIGESTASSKSNAGIYDPAYRGRLAYHGVIFDRSGKALPSSLKTLVEDEILKRRDSPPMDDQEVAALQKQLESVEDEEEDQIKEQIIQHLLPNVVSYTNLKTAVGLPFKHEVVPRKPSYNILPLVQPKPDYLYGYPLGAFSSSQQDAQTNHRISSYSRPNTSTHWPFFSIEFKSQSRGRTLWAAVNQNATTGAVCTRAVEVLFSYARQQNPDLSRDASSAVAFSTSIDAEIATLWIHWQAEDQHQWIGSKINTFVLCKPDDIRQFRLMTKNIIDYGLNKRLPVLKQALDSLPLDVWYAEDQAATQSLKRTRSQRKISSSPQTGSSLEPDAVSSSTLTSPLNREDEDKASKKRAYDR